MGESVMKYIHYVVDNYFTPHRLWTFTKRRWLVERLVL